MCRALLAEPCLGQDLTLHRWTRPDPAQLRLCLTGAARAGHPRDWRAVWPGRGAQLCGPRRRLALPQRAGGHARAQPRAGRDVGRPDVHDRAHADRGHHAQQGAPAPPAADKLRRPARRPASPRSRDGMPLAGPAAVASCCCESCTRRSRVVHAWQGPCSQVHLSSVPKTCSTGCKLAWTSAGERGCAMLHTPGPLAACGLHGQHAVTPHQASVTGCDDS